jgi:signal transduction histidine kinase
VISIFVFAYLINKVQMSNLPNALRYSSFLIYFTGLLPFFFNLAGQAITDDPRNNFPTLITAFALPVTYYLFMEMLQVLRPRAIDLVRNDELRASTALQDSVTSIVNEEFAHNLSHQWAVFIHGKILTRLAATSLKLDTATNAGDSQAFESTLQSLFTLLKAPDAELEEQSKDLEAEVTSRLNPWIGLLDIDIQIDEDLKRVQSPGVRDLAEVIEELISNSIRHGKSKKIDLRITRSGKNEVEIIAKDNATIAPPKLKYNTGLGTRIFNLASDGRWSLKRLGNSTEFRLTMGI